MYGILYLKLVLIVKNYKFVAKAMFHLELTV